MSMHNAFAAAERLAPLPETREEATTEVWLKHYAALAMAAHAAFRDAISGPRQTEPRPELGYLMEIATSATAAAVALSTPVSGAPGLIWDLAPELGALNGEYVDWLAILLDNLGINPADIERHYEAADFNSVSRPRPGVVEHAWATD